MRRESYNNNDGRKRIMLKERGHSSLVKSNFLLPEGRGSVENLLPLGRRWPDGARGRQGEKGSA